MTKSHLLWKTSKPLLKLHQTAPYSQIHKAPNDYGEGRFAYQLSREQKDVEVQMPGWSLERVRFLGEKGQNVFDSPRLYVDGSSWLWKYAVEIIKGTYKNPEQE